MKRVFLSYCYTDKDKAFANKLTKELQKWDIEVHTGETEFNPGGFIEKEIIEAIKGVDFLVAVLSKSSKNSDWVNFEVNVALLQQDTGKDIGFIPVLIEGYEIQKQFKKRLYIDFRDPKNQEARLRKLIKAILSGPERGMRVDENIRKCIQTEIVKFTERVDDYAERIKVYRHLMTSKQISRKERIVRYEIWVITKNLENDLHDHDICESVKINLSSGKRYTYFVPETRRMEQKIKDYNRIFGEWNEYYDFVKLPGNMILPFVEIVIYDPNEEYCRWGYLQIQYPDKENLFAELSEANILDIHSFFGSYINKK